MAAERIPQRRSANSASANHLADTELLSVTVLQHDHAVVIASVAGEVDMLTGPSRTHDLTDYEAARGRSTALLPAQIGAADRR